MNRLGGMAARRDVRIMEEEGGGREDVVDVWEAWETSGVSMSTLGSLLGSLKERTGVLGCSALLSTACEGKGHTPDGRVMVLRSSLR